MQRWNVGILIFDDVEVLDFAGPFEVFSRTRLQSGPESRRTDDTAPFHVFTVARSSAPVATTGGLRVLPQFAFADTPPIDLLVVPGGFGTRALMHDEDTLAWIRAVAAKARKVTSVCTARCSWRAPAFWRAAARRRTGARSTCSRDRTRSIAAGSISAHGSRISKPRRVSSGSNRSREKKRPASEKPSGLATYSVVTSRWPALPRGRTRPRSRTSTRRTRATPPARRLPPAGRPAPSGSSRSAGPPSLWSSAGADRC